MSSTERLMRAMTHLNIGAAIAVSAWILTSGQSLPGVEVVRQEPPGREIARIEALAPSQATAPQTGEVTR